VSKKIVSIIVFPGSNCDRDLEIAIRQHMNVKTEYIWHNEANLSKKKMIFLPGGFSFGDYLRSGAMATKSPAIKEVIRLSKKGVPIIGICNGFQILTECNLLDGALIDNKNQLFICRECFLRVENNQSIFSKEIKRKVVQFPIAHAQGNYYTSNDNLKKLEDNNQIIFKYSSKSGIVNVDFNPNGSLNNIAGIVNKEKNVLGLMPHPERAIEYNNEKHGVNFFNGLKGLLWKKFREK